MLERSGCNDLPHTHAACIRTHPDIRPVRTPEHDVELLAPALPQKRLCVSSAGFFPSGRGHPVECFPVTAES